MALKNLASIGLDFGTESVRAVIVGLRGRPLASSVVPYLHGQITRVLPKTGEKLPPDFALQHPQDWLDSSAAAVRAALRKGRVAPQQIVGIGVDFTSCTMLPSLSDGTPLCMSPKFSGQKYAWPKLWKHHAAMAQTDRINQLARRTKQPWLKHYGGTIGLEWFFPKVLETLDRAPDVYQATDVWLEAGDWFVWQLVGGGADELPRSTCQAGYKAMWNAESGYPSPAFFRGLHLKMADVVTRRMPGRLLSPGQLAGELTQSMAKSLGLRAGIPVSAAIIDAHSGVLGAGASKPNTLVMVMGTSSCHMLNSTVTQYAPGVAGIVAGGILPGYVGYETGQAAVGDAFDWLRRTLGHDNFDQLTAEALQIPAGADGVRCLDWFNGCRTPLMDGKLRGAFTGLTLNHSPATLYRAVLEASAFGLRWIVETLRQSGVPVERFVATGGLPHHNPLLVQICADVLGEKISVPPSKHGPALGAAILGALAAGPQQTGFRSHAEAIDAMSRDRAAGKDKVVKPQREAQRAYEPAYREYLELAKILGPRATADSDE